MDKPKQSVPVEDLERMLQDSRESTIWETDELAFLRTLLRCLCAGMSYADALQSTHSQLADLISGE